VQQVVARHAVRVLGQQPVRAPDRRARKSLWALLHELVKVLDGVEDHDAAPVQWQRSTSFSTARERTAAQSGADEEGRDGPVLRQVAEQLVPRLAERLQRPKEGESPGACSHSAW